MDYNKVFADQLAELRDEGRYRVFANWYGMPGIFQGQPVTLMAKNRTLLFGVQMTISAWGKTKT